MTNYYNINVTLHLTKNSDTGSGFCTTGFTFGRNLVKDSTGEIFSNLPTMGHLVTVCGYPYGGIQSGAYWFSIENEDNVVLYQPLATASGSTFAVFPNIYYPANSKFVAHCDDSGAGMYKFNILVRK
ncbi:MAG: hypothetical protein DRI44_04620 [Chlamydiae bacterium]|nr:MAG: hypothetical protein DRI44_04620 [Chlamydiota bacterium]